MLDAEADVCILIEGPLPRRFFIRGLKRNRLVAVSLWLHAAVPHPMIHVAATEDNQARFEFLFVGDKRHVRLLSLNPFCADSVQISSASH